MHWAWFCGFLTKIVSANVCMIDLHNVSRRTKNVNFSENRLFLESLKYILTPGKCAYLNFTIGFRLTTRV